MQEAQLLCGLGRKTCYPKAPSKKNICKNIIRSIHQKPLKHSRECLPEASLTACAKAINTILFRPYCSHPPAIFQEYERRRIQNISEDYMPKVTVDIPQHIIDDVQAHVGDGRKFVSFSDAVRTALRKMLDQLDEIDRRRGRAQE